MRPAGWLMLCSVAFGAGAWLVLSGWRQPRPRLDRAIAHLRRPATPAVRADGSSSVLASLGAFVERRGADAWTRAWVQPLRLVGRSVEVHVGHLVVAALAGLVVPAVVLGALQASGVVSIGLWIPTAVSLIAAVLAPLVVHSTTMAASADVAVDLRHQLGA